MRMLWDCGIKNGIKKKHFPNPGSFVWTRELFNLYYHDMPEKSREKRSFTAPFRT